MVAIWRNFMSSICCLGISPKEFILAISFVGGIQWFRRFVVCVDQASVLNISEFSKKKPPPKAGVSKRISGVCPCFHPVKRFHGKRHAQNSYGRDVWAMDRRSNWLPLGGPSELLLPSRSPEFAAFFEVVPLVQLFPADVARHKGVAVLVNAIGEVLASHADDSDPKDWRWLRLPL